MTHHQPLTIDFFTHQGLPAPRLTTEQARRTAAEHFGLAVCAEALGSQQDANFLLTHDDGSPVAVTEPIPTLSADSPRKWSLMAPVSAKSDSTSRRRSSSPAQAAAR